MNRLYYAKPADEWSEALPLGNGRIGAMVYGNAADELIAMNEDTVWSGYPQCSDGKGQDIHFKKARQLVLEGKISEARLILEDDFSDFLTQMYLPLANIHINMEHSKQVENYSRCLSLDDAVHTVSYRADGNDYKREIFISHPGQVMAIKITGGGAEGISFSTGLEARLQCNAYAEDSMIILEGNCPVCEAPHRGDFHSGAPGSQKYHEDDARKGTGYKAALRVINKGGKTECIDGRICVKNAEEATLIFAVRTSFNGFDKHPVLEGKPYRDECMTDLENARKKGYDALRSAAIADHKSLFDRVSLEIGGDPESIEDIPTDERLERLAGGERDNKLAVLFFNFGRYLAISSSREGTQAANLQGIWNDQLFPMWSSNYTININTEMNYWPTLVCRLNECYKPLIELVKELAVNGEKTAREYYDTQGFVSHHATDIWRITHPNSNKLPGNCQWGFWNMSSGWFCKMLYDYYAYTEDTAYLSEIYPILLQSAAFYKSLLIKDDTGSYIMCPSTSPENNYIVDGQALPLDKTTTMTTAIMRDVFKCTSDAAKILGESFEEWDAVMNSLPGYSIDSDGSLREWYAEREIWQPEHRHISHLYGLFPSNQINEKTPELIEACKKTLKERGDGATGWSIAWKINFWARLQDGNRALSILKRQLRPVTKSNVEVDVGGTYISMLCAHPPFQIDGNFGACSGIAQMLMQYRDDTVYLLPALPDEWQDGEVKGFQLPGGAWIDFSWKNGIVSEYKIHNAKREYKVK